MIACCVAGSVTGQPRKAKSTPFLRLIFIANCFTPAENSAFRYAAANLSTEYERDVRNGQVVKRIYFDNARQVVDSINSQVLVIKSVDFLSHAKSDRIGAYVTKRNRQYRTSLFESRERMQEVAAHADGEGLANSRKMACIDDIDFSRFAYDAVIEIHGCHAGTEQDPLPDNICKRLSLALYGAGKQLAVVIGHSTRANPNLARNNAARGGTAAGDISYKQSVLAQDYRHGLRMIYFGGKVIFSTRQSGGIPQSTIFDAIIRARTAREKAGAGVSGGCILSFGFFACSGAAVVSSNIVRS
jgi:hypothetical protein